jgi:hypothetical protein
VGFDEEDKRLRRRRRGHISRPLNASGAGGASAKGKASSHAGPPSTTAHPYTFSSYRALPVPDFIRPPTSAALRLLHKLASDPGILGVMEKHKWKVPLLAEMPPEGKVGVSESCVLGYNVNAAGLYKLTPVITHSLESAWFLKPVSLSSKELVSKFAALKCNLYRYNAGQEIHLRLRTDDLKGFRRYARIRETLLHELTHNVWVRRGVCKKEKRK